MFINQIVGIRLQRQQETVGLIAVVLTVVWSPTHAVLTRVLIKIYSRWDLTVPVAARSTAARLLRLWVRIPPRAWMFVCCKCCVLSGRGLCDELITCPEESYRLWRVVVCDLETLKKRLKPAKGLWIQTHNRLWRREKKKSRGDHNLKWSAAPADDRHSAANPRTD